MIFAYPNLVPVPRQLDRNAPSPPGFRAPKLLSIVSTILGPKANTRLQWLMKPKQLKWRLWQLKRRLRSLQLYRLKNKDTKLLGCVQKNKSHSATFKRQLKLFNKPKTNGRDVSTGATGATVVTPNFWDTLTLLQPGGGKFCPPLQR